MDNPGSRSRASSRGPSRSTTSAPWAMRIAGAMAREVATMQPAITFNPRSRAAARSASASVRPPVLSSLMFTQA